MLGMRTFPRNQLIQGTLYKGHMTNFSPSQKHAEDSAITNMSVKKWARTEVALTQDVAWT